MKKRAFGLFAVVLMLLCLLPSVALAADVTLLTQDNITSYMTLTGGSYKLDSNITISSTIIVKGNVTLDLNGHVLQNTGHGSVLEVNEGGSLTLNNNAAGASHKFKVSDSGLWVLDETNGTKTVQGGVITGSDTGSSGVYVASKAFFEMNGGNIVGCSDTIGGGVYVKGSASFTMNGGSLVGCTASYGSGVWVSAGGSFTMSGGSIVECTATNGSGVYVNAGGSFSMSGAAVVGPNNAVTNSSSNIYLNAGRDMAIMNADGGTVEGAVINKGTITRSDDATGITNFNGTVENRGTISNGNFNGAVVNYKTISGGTFYGSITGSGTASGHTVIQAPATDSGSSTGSATTSSTFHTVRATAGEGGSLSESIVSLRPGESFTFAFSPNAGYAVADVKVDGQSVGAVESYTFRNLTADKTLEVEFAPVGATGTPADADKNPNTGAADALGVAAGLAALSLLAAAATRKKH